MYEMISQYHQLQHWYPALWHNQQHLQQIGKASYFHSHCYMEAAQTLRLVRALKSTNQKKYLKTHSIFTQDCSTLIVYIGHAQHSLVLGEGRFDAHD